MYEEVSPFDLQEVSAPANELWSKRRDIAAKLRRLNELSVSSGADLVSLKQVDRLLGEQLNILEAMPVAQGRLQQQKVEGYSDNVHYELNPLSGRSSPIAPPINSWREGDEYHGRVTMGWQYEGPPSCVHGGYIAAIFDDFLGVAQRLTAQPGMTGKLTVRYRKPTPINTELVLRGYVKKVEGRKNILVAEMLANGVVTANCKGLFIAISPHKMRAMMDKLNEV